MARRSAEDMLRTDLYSTTEHKGIRIEFNPGYKNHPPYFRVNKEHHCSTLEGAIKRANYISLKDRKLKEPIPILCWERNCYRNADIVEIHNDGSVVIQDYETNEREKLNDYQLKYKIPYKDTPENRSTMDDMVELRNQIQKLEGNFTALKGILMQEKIERSTD